MIDEQVYVLVTAHNTFLDVYREAEFIHHRTSAIRRVPALTLSRLGQVSVPICDGYLIEQIADEGLYVVRLHNLYISAVPDGRVVLVPHRGTWEIFRLVAYDRALGSVLRDLPALPYMPASRMIPKVIHQTSSSMEPPPECRDNIKRLMALNPDWTYRYWSHKDAHDFIYEHYGWEVLDTYFKITSCYGAARADFFRYLLIYQVGGVYLDIKSSMMKRFDDVLREDDQYLLSQWRNGGDSQYKGFGLHADLMGIIPKGEYQQWHIIAAAGHKFLEAVIMRVLHNISNYRIELDGTGWIGVLRTTGPIAYSLAIHPYRQTQPHRMIDAEEAGFLFKAVPRPETTAHYTTLNAPIAS